MKSQLSYSIFHTGMKSHICGNKIQEASKQCGNDLSEKLSKDELHFACHKNLHMHVVTYVLIEADVVDGTKISEAISTSMYVFESDKHPVNNLVDIFSGRVIDDAVVNTYNSVEIGATQWLREE